MNKSLLTVCFFFFVAQSITCAPKYEEEENKVSDEYSELQEGFIEIYKLINFDIVGKIKNSMSGLTFDQEKCENFDEKFNDTIDEIRQCHKEIHVGSNTVCTTLTSFIIKCSLPAKDLLSDCMYEGAKELPLLFRKALIGITKQTCNTTLEDAIEIFNPCQFKRDWHNAPECADLDRTLKSYKGDALPTASYVCSLWPTAKKCSKFVHRISCKNPVMFNTFAKFHESVKEETDEICHYKEE